MTAKIIPINSRARGPSREGVEGTRWTIRSRSRSAIWLDEMADEPGLVWPVEGWRDNLCSDEHYDGAKFLMGRRCDECGQAYCVRALRDTPYCAQEVPS